MVESRFVQPMDGVVVIKTKEPRAASRRTNEAALHSVADGHYKKVLSITEYAFAAGRRAVQKDKLKAALLAKDMKAVVLAVAAAPSVVAAEFEALLPKIVTKMIEAGGETGLELLREKLRTAEGLRAAANDSFTKMRFDASNPHAVRWAKKHVGELIKEISVTTRQRIAEAVVRLVSGEDHEGAFDEILAAVGDTARADLIARTETMTATNQGQREAWGQAVDAGLLSGRERRTWIATEGACPLCEELDGEVVDLDKEYSNGGDGPPLHPNCRCTEGLI